MPGEFAAIAPGVVTTHDGTRTWDVIRGVAEQREISLLGCVPNGGKKVIGARGKSPDTQTVMATTALIGAHVSTGDEAAFSAAEERPAGA